MSTETTAPAGWIFFPSGRAHFIRDGRPVCRPLKSWRGRVEKSVAHLGPVGRWYRCRRCFASLGLKESEVCAWCSEPRDDEAGWLVEQADGAFVPAETIPADAPAVLCPRCQHRRQLRRR